MKRVINIGSRASRLSLIQTESVMSGLKQARPALEFQIVKITTSGDAQSKVPLVELSGTGIFVKELEEALLEGRIDLAVHSLKDLPSELPAGLSLGAVPVRNDPRDVFVSRTVRLEEITGGSRIGTGSPRRAVQLRAVRPDLEVSDIRGNVDTRLRKVSSGDFDGAILAAAALIRMGLEERITQYLPTDRFLPAVGQGALGIEIRLADREVSELVSTINHLPSRQAVTAERFFLKTLGGGCRAPIAAYARVNGDVLELEGMIASIVSGKILRSSIRGKLDGTEDLGAKLAGDLLKMGGSQFVDEVKDR